MIFLGRPDLRRLSIKVCVRSWRDGEPSTGGREDGAAARELRVLGAILNRFWVLEELGVVKAKGI